MDRLVPGVTATVDCQVCGALLPEPVLDLGLQPLCDDLVRIGEGRTTPLYPIRISICPVCLTAHQAFNVRKEILFPTEYHYRPRFTQDVLAGMAGLVTEHVAKFGSVAGKLVCDVGCSDGSLLTYFRRAGAKTCGIEPTGASVEAASAGHATFNEFFSLDAAQRLVAEFGKPDVVTFTNVFAHIEDLAEALAALRVLIKSDTLVVIENHYLGSVLDQKQFDTFYHEHPRTYSLRSFGYISRALGGEIVSVTFPKRYGGNIRVVIGEFTGSAANSGTAAWLESARAESHFPAALARMQQFTEDWRAQAMAALRDLAASGVAVSGKSFPGRASILVNLLGIDADTHQAVYERPGSLKIGHYVPGTRIPIVSDDRWASGADKPNGILVWGWHIVPEIAAYMRERGYRGRLFTPLPEFAEI